MKTRNGKIARLSLEIRERLNHRLSDGEPGNRLVEWLNSVPDVMQVMAEQFEGRPITENNLSEWRAGGYEEWTTLHSFLDETRVLSENAGEVAETGISSDHMHIVLLAHHAHLLQNLGIMPEDEYQTRLNTVRKLTASVMKMRRDELQKARFELQRERLEFLREKEALKSASSSKGAASTSANVHPLPAETKQPPTPAPAPSHPDIHTSAKSSSDEHAAPPLFTLNPKPATKIPILSGRIQPESPCLSEKHRAPFRSLEDWLDSLGLGDKVEPPFLQDWLDSLGLGEPPKRPGSKFGKEWLDSLGSALAHRPKIAA